MGSAEAKAQASLTHHVSLSHCWWRRGREITVVLATSRTGGREALTEQKIFCTDARNLML